MAFHAPPVASAEEPWHSRLSIASRYMNLASEFHHYYDNHDFNDHSGEDEDDDDAMMAMFGPPADNRSHQCFTSCSGACLPCPYDDKPLWWLVLRWMKMMLFRIARSYNAKPMLLVVAPLVAGLLVGYWLGRQRQGSHNEAARSQIHIPNRPTKGPRGLLQRASDFMTVVAFRLSTVLPLQEDDRHPVFASTESSAPIYTQEPATIATKSTTRSGTSTGDGSKCDPDLAIREETVRTNLKSDNGTARESGVSVSEVPRHVAVIMDGNRRYGNAKYGSATRGHWDGSSKLVEFATWCLAEQVKVLTVFAFSSENWNRDPAEIASLMQIFAKYCDELRVEALKRNIKIVILSTDFEKVSHENSLIPTSIAYSCSHRRTLRESLGSKKQQIPVHVQEGLNRMEAETEHCNGMIMNICLSYGSRGEIVAAARSIAVDVLQGRIKDPELSVDEGSFQDRLLTQHCGGDPDVLIRTSGEVRISNFMLWQLAYTEMFFVEKPWPAIDKDDLLKVIRAYAQGRSRRFGK